MRSATWTISSTKPRTSTTRLRIHCIRENIHAQVATANSYVTEAQATAECRVLSLEALVRVKLTAFRDKDRVHLRDMIEVGLIDASWLDRLTPELSVRLKSLLDTPGR